MGAIRRFLAILAISAVIIALPAADGDGSVTISGERKLWHRVDLRQVAKDSSVSADPNPFLDYRFNVTFTAPSGKVSVVPGYFAGDGAGGSSGNVWMAHLNPSETGTWSYQVSFRSGTNVAVELATTAGTAVAPFHGKSGTFAVSASDKSGADFRASDKGLLVNRGHHYLTYAASGTPFLFTGPGIPENILGYRGFTNTTVGIGHTFDAHLAHWSSGDPDWNGGAGKKLVGALNYIANSGGNVIYLMSNTIGGDGKDCFPHPTTDSTKTRYDLLKLHQWDIALAHAQRKGIYLHWVLAETETANYTYYGGTSSSGSLSTARKLYFRMLNARFGHYNGLKWNLCEEIEWTQAERTAQMAYLKAVDPYDHPVTFQTGGAGLPWSEFDRHLGDGNLDSLSFQGSPSRTAMFDKMAEYRTKSANAGVKLTVAWDEPQKIENDNTDEVSGYPMGRRDKMWPCLMGGGDGFLWYIQADGGGHGFDQRIEDFSIMQNALRWSAHVRTFLGVLPLTQMVPSRTLASGASGTQSYCLYQTGEVYAVYNDRSGTGLSLNLSAVASSVTFTVQWFDPRNGGTLKTGTVASVSGGAVRSLGSAPNTTNQDWAVLVKRSAGGGTPTNLAPVVSAGPNRSVTLPSTASLDGVVSDDGLPSGSSVTTTWTVVSGPGSVSFATASSVDTTASFSLSGTYVLRLTASDGALSSSDDMQVTVSAATGSFLTHTLINADTDVLIVGFDPLVAGAVLDLAALPSRKLAIRANPTTAVGSIRMVLSGAQAKTQTESVAPYALHGDTSGDFNVWTPVVGSYSLTSTAYSGSGASGSVLGSQTISFTVVDGGGTGGLPAGWTAGDIGTVTPSGTTTLDAGTWTVAGSGADIWGSKDAFRFAHVPTSGDLSITVRVQAQTATHAWAKAGLMIRESTAAGSRHVSIFATPSKGVSFQRRTATNGTSASTAGPVTPAPVWLRLERIGSAVTGYQSLNGMTWTMVAQVNATLGTTPLVGLAVTSHLNGTLSTAVFTDLSIIALPVGNG